MNVLALVVFGVYFLLAFAARTLVQVVRTGDSGFRGVSGAPGSARWWAGVLFAAAITAGLAGPLSALAGLDPVPVLDRAWVAAAATAAAVLGVVATVVTQLAMGTSWRIGVDPDERTALVTTGPFALVRNPIFTAMAVTGLGLALMVPNVVALTGVLVLVVALQLQVRVVEEPYLRATHGRACQAYTTTTGRFIPGLGRSRTPVCEVR